MTRASAYCLITKLSAAVGEADGDGLGDGLDVGEADGDGLGLAVGEADGDELGEGLGVGEADGDGLGDGLGLAVGEADGDGLGDGLGVGEADGLGDGLGLAVGLLSTTAWLILLSRLLLSTIAKLFLISTKPVRNLTPSVSVEEIFAFFRSGAMSLSPSSLATMLCNLLVAESFCVVSWSSLNRSWIMSLAPTERFLASAVVSGVVCTFTLNNSSSDCRV